MATRLHSETETLKRLQEMLPRARGSTIGVLLTDFCGTALTGAVTREILSFSPKR